MIKLYLKDDVILPGMFLTHGICYKTEEDIMYDAGDSLSWYTVKCDDGKSRKVASKWFISQEDWRELKLNELGL